MFADWLDRVAPLPAEGPQIFTVVNDVYQFLNCFFRLNSQKMQLLGHMTLMYLKVLIRFTGSECLYQFMSRPSPNVEHAARSLLPMLLFLSHLADYFSCSFLVCVFCLSREAEHFSYLYWPWSRYYFWALTHCWHFNDQGEKEKGNRRAPFFRIHSCAEEMTPQAAQPGGKI